MGNDCEPMKCVGLGAIAFGLAIVLGCSGFSPSISRDRCADAEFVFIPAGDFIAGSDLAERDLAYLISAEALADTPDAIARTEQQLRDRRWFEFEPEQETRSLPTLCIRRNLVTNADYQAFIAATEHPEPGITAEAYQEQGFLVHPYADVEPYLWQDGQFPDGNAEHPVVLVSYEDAIAYANWRGEQDGHTYRLPTAEEWEKAARGTDGRYFPWGNAWQGDATNWAQSGGLKTSAIATYPLSRSIYGVEDMAGNVFEFTSTLDTERSPAEAIMKGCSWDDLPGFCRAAYRHDRPVTSRHILFGFRLVRES
jgi:formylglycine-generating enzyme required for sulfatase activity